MSSSTSSTNTTRSDRRTYPYNDRDRETFYLDYNSNIKVKALKEGLSWLLSKSQIQKRREPPTGGTLLEAPAGSDRATKNRIEMANIVIKESLRAETTKWVKVDQEIEKGFGILNAESFDSIVQNSYAHTALLRVQRANPDATQEDLFYLYAAEMNTFKMDNSADIEIYRDNIRRATDKHGWAALRVIYDTNMNALTDITIEEEDENGVKVVVGNHRPTPKEQRDWLLQAVRNDKFNSIICKWGADESITYEEMVEEIEEQLKLHSWWDESWIEKNKESTSANIITANKVDTYIGATKKAFDLDRLGKSSTSSSGNQAVASNCFRCGRKGHWSNECRSTTCKCGVILSKDEKHKCDLLDALKNQLTSVDNNNNKHKFKKRDKRQVSQSNNNNNNNNNNKSGSSGNTDANLIANLTKSIESLKRQVAEMSKGSSSVTDESSKKGRRSK
jgi:Zinc knuckle